MSSKRKFADFNADAKPQEARHRAPAHRLPKKNRKNSEKDHKTRPDNLNWLKKRVRDIERRFQAGKNLPANVQNELERELAHHQQKIVEITDDKKRKLMITKYHMVRFHERKKADRLAKQIRTQLEAATDEEEIKKLKADLHIAKVDGLYARYFPHRERYVSMYPVSSRDPSSNGGEKSENASSAALALHRERPALWALIEKASEKGEAALTEIRERKSDGSSRSKTAEEQITEEPSTTKTDRPRTKRSSAPDSAGAWRGKGKPYGQTETNDDGGSDSEGGFFEEE
ncbi:hypothetical protein F4775DRAFT_531891 [Biscogniauxia sp. FL1348]|nr:hypothetical protein F4775DRAFT_531891 [Biscogniauxia sp. FL1348]